MSAIVCRKRSNSVFEEIHSSPPNSKRFRCSAALSSPFTAAALRFSPPRTCFDPRDTSASANISAADSSSPISRLRSLFPDMDLQILERALEASGNDLDSAIRSLNGLHLGSPEANLGFAANKSESGVEANALPAEAIMNKSRDAAPEDGSVAVQLPSDGSEWVELFVREMMNARDMDDARTRASGVLEVLEKSILKHSESQATGSLHKEHVMLKEQVEALLRENAILKRAVAIQHERQKAYNESSQELQNLKQLVSQYQEQMRTLEVNNYGLMMHLRQAQQGSSIPGRFNPDIF